MARLLSVRRDLWRRAGFGCIMTSMIRAALSAILLLSGATTLAADGIELTGAAEMGLVSTSTDAGPTVRLFTDLDLDGRASITTDGGLTIAFEFNLDNLRINEDD